MESKFPIPSNSRELDQAGLVPRVPGRKRNLRLHSPYPHPMQLPYDFNGNGKPDFQDHLMQEAFLPEKSQARGEGGKSGGYDPTPTKPAPTGGPVKKLHPACGCAILAVFGSRSWRCTAPGSLDTSLI